MSKPLSRRSRDFFTGIPNIYSASPDFGVPLDYVRAGSSHLIEVELPQTNYTGSGDALASLGCNLLQVAVLQPTAHTTTVNMACE